MKKEIFIKNWLNYNGKDLKIKLLERWVCLSVLAGSELEIAFKLSDKNVPFFIPIYKGLNNQFRALFPGYIFARMSSDTQYYIENISLKVLYVGYPCGEKRLISELERFSHYYEIAEKFEIGDEIVIDNFNNHKQLGGVISEIDDFSGDVVINLPFFGRETKVKVSQKLISYKDRSFNRRILTPSGKEILSEKYITKEEKQLVQKPINLILETVNSELIKFLRNKPDYLYHLNSRKYEELVAELLKDMGYEIHLTPETRDGGRDIIAIIDLPPNRKLLTVVECKRYAANRKIGIDILERFLWILKQKYDTNGGLIVTTSFFSNDAKKYQQQYSHSLSLYDFDSMKTWLNNYGNWEKNENGTIWLPKDKFTASNILYK